MVVEGGMGTVARVLEEAAREAGVTFHTEAEVAAVDVEEGVARGVTLADGRSFRAPVVVLGTDPFRFVDMAPFPEDFVARVDGWRRDGTTMKLNLCLAELPEFTCLREDRGQHRGTIHLLPEEDVVLETLATAYRDVRAGKLPELPAIEWYIHTTVDPSLSDAAGRHSAALFVQWVPYELEGTTWEAEESRYAEHLLSICDRFAPGTSDLVVDTYPLTPPKLEERFGLSRGHIHHVDNSFGFDDRLPHRLPLEGLYACGAGCHPGGSVIGAAGHNAAAQILEDGA
jgi:phytoene dehydrogenase-like protein